MVTKLSNRGGPSEHIRTLFLRDATSADARRVAREEIERFELQGWRTERVGW